MKTTDHICVYNLGCEVQEIYRMKGLLHLYEIDNYLSIEVIFLN